MNLASLALPPIGGLLVLLFGYVVLVGPVNYIVLRRIDRREWAWITVPVLIVVFTVGSFGIGGLLRGSDVIVHEVGIVRGAPGRGCGHDPVVPRASSARPGRPTRSRSRATRCWQPPMNGDIFGTGAGTALDVLQGDPSRVRDLDVGYGSIRTIRAEASATAPEVTASLRLADGRLQGTVTNESIDVPRRRRARPRLVGSPGSVTSRPGQRPGWIWAWHPPRSTGTRCRSGSSGR